MADLEYTQYGDRMQIEEGYSIRELIDILLAHLKMILIITIVAGLLAFVISQFFITPQYEASVKLFVNNSRAGQADTTSISDLNASERLVNTYMEIVKSNTVLEKVALNDNLDYSIESLKKMVSTQAVQNTEIFYVKVMSDNPHHAQLLANRIAMDAPEEIMDFVEATSVKVIDFATLPTDQATPNVKLNTAIGLLLGLVLSVLLVLLLDMLDVTIRSEEDIKRLTDLPVLGVIPFIETMDGKGKTNGYVYGGKYGY
jgi:capsular polysaccharide biosynthesis protein